MESISKQLAASLEEKLRTRSEGQKRWLLKQNDGKCFQEQLHTKEGTEERIYWHYGYRAALCDILGLLERDRAELN